jgi:branched-chain amino acid transport system permease protein
MLDGVLRFHLGEGFVQITYTKVFILVASFGDAAADLDNWQYPLAHVPRGSAGSQNGLDSRDQHRQDHLPGICHWRGDGGLAGVLITMNYGTFDFYVGFVIGIKAFTAAVLGESAHYRAPCSAG